MSDIHICCPVCRNVKLMPRPRPIREVTWGTDCVCRDTGACVYHRHHPSGAPSRPTDAALADKSERQYMRDLEDWTNERFQYEQAEKLGDLLRQYPDLADRVSTMLAQGTKP